MLKAIRYTLAAICLAASVGCLALWWFTVTNHELLGARYRKAEAEIGIAADFGFASCWVANYPPTNHQLGLSFAAFDAREPPAFFSVVESQGSFGVSNETIFFPLWYPALVFALAAVGALCLGRRFTVRSAIIVTAVVAALMGMVVAL